MSCLLRLKQALKACNVGTVLFYNYFSNIKSVIITLSESSKHCLYHDIVLYSRVAYIYVRSRAKYLKFRTTTSKFNTLRKPLMQQKYYFIHEM